MLQNGGSPTNTPPAPVMQPNGAARGKEAKATAELTSLSWDRASAFCGDEVEARAQASDARDGAFPLRVWRTAGDMLQTVLPARMKANQASVKWKVQRGPAADAVQLELRHKNPDGKQVKSGQLEVKGIPAAAKATVGPVKRLTPQYELIAGAWVRKRRNFEWQYYYTIEIAGGEVKVHRPVEFAVQPGWAHGGPPAA